MSRHVYFLEEDIVLNKPVDMHEIQDNDQQLKEIVSSPFVNHKDIVPL